MLLLGGRTAALGKLLEKSCQAGEELARGFKSIVIEVAEAENQRPKLIAENVNHSQELVPLRIALHQDLPMRDHLRNFRSEDKFRRRLLVPALHRRGGGHCVLGAHARRAEPALRLNPS